MVKNSAYTLLELSIVILIISILITGALTVASNSIITAKNKTSEEKVKQIYKSIGNFLVVNKRLPCPASILKIKNVDSDYGIEVGGGSSGCVGAGVYQSTTSTNLVYGMVPIRALGLSNDMVEDGFESKIAYIVDKRFTYDFQDTPNFSSLSFGTSPFVNIINIKEKPLDAEQTSSTNAIIALISYGSNRSGAFLASSASQNARSTDADEMQNDITNLNNSSSPPSAIFDNNLTVNSGNSDIFDDLILFKTRNDLIEDFDMMSIIPCDSSSITASGFPAINVYYGNYVYATSSCPSPNEDKVKIKKCEAYGNWIDVVANCP